LIRTHHSQRGKRAYTDDQRRCEHDQDAAIHADFQGEFIVFALCAACTRAG
jgi:hypothetical protein